MPLLTKEPGGRRGSLDVAARNGGARRCPDRRPRSFRSRLWLGAAQCAGGRGDIGVWLKPADDPDALADDVARLPLIAVDFPQFGDGRGYSTARLLREKYRYTGELRAIGDILRDQLYFLLQCGFDTFALQPGRNVAEALAAFDDFSDSYQATVAQPVPLFRRRLQTARIAKEAKQ